MPAAGSHDTLAWSGSIIFTIMRMMWRGVRNWPLVPAWSAVKDTNLLVDFHSDEGFETILGRELIEIACLKGVSDPESLRDILLSRLRRKNLDTSKHDRVTLSDA